MRFSRGIIELYEKTEDLLSVRCEFFVPYVVINTLAKNKKYECIRKFVPPKRLSKPEE